MNKVFFLSSLFPKKQIKYIKENSIGAIANANDSFQWSLVRGFIDNGYHVNLINVPNLGAYPFKFKKMVTESNTFDSIGSNIKGKSFGILNLNIIKHFSAYIKLLNYIKKLESDSIDTLLIYDVYPPFLKLLKTLCLNQKNIKIFLIVPDIYGFTRDKTNIINKILDFFNKKIIAKGLEHVDGYVYLTELMQEKMPCVALRKNYTVVEGILNPDNIVYEIKRKEKRYILYTGSLDVRHGLLNLVDAFLEAQLVDVELYICGDGAGKVQLLNRISGKENIKYLGQISREEVVRLQAEAFLLINPRTSEGEFTKYSFPSKVIEYFMSGTPTFMYKLEGIPAEYYQYCFSSKDESVEGLINNLKKINEMDTDELIQKGIEARKFIQENKNCKAQVNKIINLIKKK